MKGLKTTKRLIAAVLSLVMMLGMLPVIPLSINAAGTDGTTNFVSLPITIRDFPADGMLFECNELAGTGEYTETTSASGNPEKYFTDNYGLGAGDKATGTGYMRYTATSTGMYITYNIDQTHTQSGIRYVVIKYRTNAAKSSGSTPQIADRTNGGGTFSYTDFPLDGYNKTDFETVVLDMGEGNSAVNYVTLYPRLDIGNYIEIAYIAFFDTKAEADAYKASEIVTYNLGNTLGYGLLFVNGNTYNPATEGYYAAPTLVNNGVGTSALEITGSTLIRNQETSGSVAPSAMDVSLNSDVIQHLHGGFVRTDLVEPTLGANGKLVYTKGTVDYLANYMALTLPQPKVASNGALNMWYVMGDKVFGDSDLAAKLRTQINNTKGTYDAAKAKYEAGNLNSYTQVESYYDAAYFLLHNMFSDSEGYGKTVDAYDTLNLIQKTDSNGNTYYTFNSAYGAVESEGKQGVVYDKENGIIYNDQVEDIPIRQLYSEEKGEYADWYSRGNKMPKNCFNPVYGLGYATESNPGSNDTYKNYCAKYQIGQGDKDELAYYDEVNFNFTLEGHAEFIYHQDDNLYFTFTGDDDVYLYINGVRVLDLGGAHQISKVQINLNEVAEQCNLHDGEIYTFDFFYMERHGSAANFGIETNIKIVDPAMVTEKRAWQNDNLVGYNGYVLPDTDIVYDLSITNNGETSIGDLTFLDENLGVSLSKDAIVLPNGTSINDIAAYHFAADGSVKVFTNPADMTEDILKSYLAAETAETKLQVGEKLLVYGFKHKLGNNDADVFDNYVYTTAVADGENVDDAKRNLNGMDNHRVQKTHYAFESLEFYDGGHLDGVTYGQMDENKSRGVTITRDELLAPMKAKEDLKNLDYSKATIALTNASGTSTSVKYNATMQADGSIFFQTDKVGTELFYYAVTIGEYTYEPIAVHVHTYGVDDSVFVLDYNLPVELFENTAHIARNDILTLNSNAGTSYSFNAPAGKVGTYGDFTAADGSLVYTMKRFLNGPDSIEVEVTVLKNGAAAVDKTTGVVLTQTVSVVPANVMYYEDDFTGEGAITYVNTGSDAEGNIWAVYEGAYKGDQQSADQDMNYGSDPNYAENGTDIWGELELSYLENAPEGVTLEAVGDEIYQTIFGSADEAIHTLFGDASNDTIHAMAINSAEAATLMSFTFTGTGFEIVGRTTTYAYAVLTIMITNVDTGAMAAFPVITECVNGDLCQIPFAARKDLAYGTYEVTVIGSNASDRDRMVYVDGVRVYHPLTEDQAATYYKADEVASQIIEIKDQIAAGNVVYGDIGVLQDNEGKTALDFNWGFGNTMIENFLPDNGFGDYTLVGCESRDEYLEYGPNNEIYLSNANGAVLSYIAFYVVLDENYEGERSIQIGAHLKSTLEGYRTDKVVIGVDPETGESIYEEVFVPQSASLRVGNRAADFENQYTAVIITTGTEQYYDVDIAWDPVNDNGVEKTLVVIGIDNAETNDVLSLTNIKLNGYKIATQTAAEMTVVQDASDINASILMSRVVAIGEALVNKD